MIKKNEMSAINELSTNSINKLLDEADLFIKKGQWESTEPCVFKLYDIYSHSPQLFDKVLPKTLRIFFCFYLSQHINSKYPDKGEDFIKSIPELIRLHWGILDKMFTRFDVNPLQYAYTLNLLSKTLIDIGLYKKAAVHCKLVMHILSDQSVQRDSVMMVVALTNYGLSLAYQDKNDDGKKILDEALDIQKRTNRINTEMTIQIHICLWILTDDIEIKKIHENEISKIKKMIPNLSSFINSQISCQFALWYKDNKDFILAIKHFKEALKFIIMSGPDRDNETFSYLYFLAILYVNNGDRINALKYFNKAQTTENQLINKVVGNITDNNLLDFLKGRHDFISIFLSFIYACCNNEQKYIYNAYAFYLSRKGLWLKIQKSFQESMLKNASPEAKVMHSELKDERAKSAYAAIRETDNKATSEESKKEEILSKQLWSSKYIPGLNKKISLNDLKKIINVLPEDTVMLEYAEVDPWDFDHQTFGEAHYYVFIITGGKTPKITIKDIGESREAWTRISSLREYMGAPGQGESRQRKNEISVIEKSKELFNFLIKPIEDQIKGKTNIIICPDTNINFLPFEILVGDDDKYLIEKYSFNYLTSGYELLKQNSNRKKGNGNKKDIAILIGNPDFDKLPVKIKMNKSQKMRGSSVSDRLKPLPNTAKEIEEIARLLRTSRYNVISCLGIEAQEKKLRDVDSSPKLLHLATHGFYSRIDSDSPKKSLTGNSDLSEQDNVPKNPFLHSGIALAGFNTSMNLEGLNDGIVTAAEVLDFNDYSG